jgi:RNA polymerase-binding transcription factor DksA
MLPEKEITYYKSKLLATKADLEQEMRGLETRPDYGADTDHREEEGDEVDALGVNLGTESVLRTRLEDVERALAKIEAGSYGTCERCAREIEREILDIDPESRLCKACKAE